MFVDQVVLLVLLLQSFDFTVNSTSAWTWFGLVTDLFNNISQITVHYLVNFVFTTGGELIFTIIQKIEDRILKSSKADKLISHL